MKESKIGAMDQFDKALAAVLGDSLTVGPPVDEAQMKWPLLWRWLTNCEAGKEYFKTPAKLAIKATRGSFIVSLSDESYGVSLDAASNSLMGVFDALETALGSSEPPIRTWPNHKPRLRKRPKQ